MAVSCVTEAGSSHRQASNFLVRDKKVTKEARLPTAIRQNSLRAYSAPFKQAAGNMKDFHTGARRLRAHGEGSGTAFFYRLLSAISSLSR